MKIPLLIIFALSAFEILAADFSAPMPASPDRLDADAMLAIEMKKNSPGCQAADFEFIDRGGSLRHLYDHIDGTDEVMLVFFDPDCSDCRRLADSLRCDTSVCRRVSTGDLRIVMITPFQTDHAQWHAYAMTLPMQWTVGYSPYGHIDEAAIYFLPQIPCVYHLSPLGTVLQRTPLRLDGVSEPASSRT